MLVFQNHPAPRQEQLCMTNLLTTTKLKMCRTQWNDLEVLSAELGRHCKFLPAPPILTFTVLCQHWWMVRNLESKLIFKMNLND
jgi:hypothetical protein